MHVGIVGVTGVVGKELIQLMEKSSLPITKLSVFASEKSQKTYCLFRKEKICVQSLSSQSFLSLDLAFFCVLSLKNNEIRLK